MEQDHKKAVEVQDDDPVWITKDTRDRAVQSAIETALTSYTPNRFQTLWRGSAVDVCFGTLRTWPAPGGRPDVYLRFPVAVTLDVEMAQQLANELTRFVAEASADRRNDSV